MAQSDDNILNHLIGIREDVSAIKTKLDALNTSMTSHVSDDKTYHEKTDTRISGLEDSQKRVKWMAVGAGAVISVLWRVIEAALKTPPH